MKSVKKEKQKKKTPELLPWRFEALAGYCNNDNRCSQQDGSNSSRHDSVSALPFNYAGIFLLLAAYFFLTVDNKSGIHTSYAVSPSEGGHSEESVAQTNYNSQGLRARTDTTTYVYDAFQRDPDGLYVNRVNVTCKTSATAAACATKAKKKKQFTTLARAPFLNATDSLVRCALASAANSWRSFLSRSQHSRHFVVRLSQGFHRARS